MNIRKNGVSFWLTLSILLGGMCFLETSLAQTSQRSTTAFNFSGLSPTGLQAEVKVITELLTRQVNSWNAGNLESFMEAYWKSEQLTFSGGGGTTRGWQATLDRYKKGYAPPKEMGKLKFGDLEATVFEQNTAMVLGNWHLTFSDGKIREGNFSLVMHKLDGKWKIIHDHSSEKKPEAKPEEQNPNLEPRKENQSSSNGGSAK